jgi:hypothetical protein
MSLLEMNSTELDDAARGEDLTKGTSHLLLGWVIAAAVVLALIAWYTIAAYSVKAPVAGQVASTTVHFVHTESSGFDAAGEAAPKESFDQVLVFTHLKLLNQTQKPLFLRQILTNVTLPDGIHSSYAASANDYQRLFEAEPALAALRGTPLPFDSTIPPGGTVEGDIVASFHLTQAQWEARKGMDYTASLQYLPNVTIPAGTVVEK